MHLYLPVDHPLRIDHLERVDRPGLNDSPEPIDNNPAENAIRPFVIGRKAWLFSNSQRGATASAHLYSLIETAKANAREPYQYLSWLFERLPTTNADDYETLMPWNMPLT